MMNLEFSKLSGLMLCFTLMLLFGTLATNTLTSTNDDLLSAAESGDVKEVGRQLIHGADVNAKSNDGATPLYFAAVTGNMDVAELLISNGAKVDTLYIAALLGQKDIAELLIAQGEDVNAREKTRIQKLQTGQAAREEKELWQKAQSSEDAKTVQTYLDKYPDGSHAAAMQDRLAVIAARQEQ